jgi:hypothetical protein
MAGADPTRDNITHSLFADAITRGFAGRAWTTAALVIASNILDIES